MTNDLFTCRMFLDESTVVDELRRTLKREGNVHCVGGGHFHVTRGR